MPSFFPAARRLVLHAALLAAPALAYAAFPAADRPPAPPALPAPDPAAPDPAVGRCAARAVAKRAVARDVIAGRRSVPEAAAVFARLDALDPPPVIDPRFLPAADGARPGTGDLVGRQVVLWVTRVAGDECPDRATVAAGRALGELRAARALGDLDRLPAVGEEAFAGLLAAAEAEAASRLHGRTGPPVPAGQMRPGPTVTAAVALAVQ